MSNLLSSTIISENIHPALTVKDGLCKVILCIRNFEKSIWFLSGDSSLWAATFILKISRMKAKMFS